MKATVEDITSVKKKLTIEIDSKEIDKRINDAYKSLARKVKIPGFRSGKVPRRILENYYGQQLLEDLSRDLVSETLPNAVEETKTFPLNVPALEKGTLKAGSNFTYSAVMEVKPEFELKDYMGLEVEKETLKVSDEDVQRQLEEIRKGNGTLTVVEEDRGIQEDDYAVIEYEGFEQGNPIEGMKADNFPLKIGSNSFHQDFERGLIGRKKEDTFEISVTFGEDYFHKAVAGKKVDFKVKIIDIKKLELPELDDEFAKKLGADVEDLEGLRKRVKEELTAAEQKRIDRDCRIRLLQKISNSVQFELPESLVENELMKAVEGVKQNLLRSGSSLEKAGISEQKIRDDFRPASETRAKNMLILGEIASQNDITVSEEEMEEGFREIALGVGQNPEMVRSYYEANQAVEPFREKLLEEKTLNYLVDGANLIEVEADKITPIDGDQVPSDAV